MPGNRLRVVRAEKRVSQLRTALRAGIDPTRLWRIENGFREPSEAERGAIATALGVGEEAIWPPETDRENDGFRVEAQARA
jgi:transcriptional regulator with XRE-family HTH domain